MGDIVESPYKCDVTGNPVGTDTVLIGFVCGCQGCRAHREIQRLRAEVEELTRSRDEWLAAAVEQRKKAERLTQIVTEGTQFMQGVPEQITASLSAATAEAMERAAQIAEQYLAMGWRGSELPAAIRAEASKKGGGGE